MSSARSVGQVEGFASNLRGCVSPLKPKKPNEIFDLWSSFKEIGDNGGTGHSAPALVRWE